MFHFDAGGNEDQVSYRQQGNRREGMHQEDRGTSDPRHGNTARAKEKQPGGGSTPIASGSRFSALYGRGEESGSEETDNRQQAAKGVGQSHGTARAWRRVEKKVPQRQEETIVEREKIEPITYGATYQIRNNSINPLFDPIFNRMSSSSGRHTSVAAGDLQMVPVAERTSAALPPRPLVPASSSAASSALVEYKPPAANPEDEDLEIKLRRILECVPVRVSNTSGSSAGSGSGDFHQYRQMRRKEQDRLSRMDADYQKRKEIAEFKERREERLKAAEERTAKKRLKRQKKKQRKKGKKSQPNAGGEDQQKEQSSDEDDGSDNEEN
ncbi:hypothetical protein BUALT_Bualt15G0044700 [Buddleja alternifolia]|uniref:PRKR-interacting protein 1 n=1 Tax=Buddleja alternifolia TaxID=168488 RepID=A0AAV6WKA4_9LAMI|nr:hypothetical protein BUALT_Bualt15G0044700 [Buddleja alternifolia]